MNDDERDIIAERTASKVIHAMRTDKKSFWIQPEEHYNHHNRLSSWFDTYDWASRVVGKAIITVILFGIFGLIVLVYNKLKF